MYPQHGLPGNVRLVSALTGDSPGVIPQAYFPVAAANYAHRLGLGSLKCDWWVNLDFETNGEKSAPTQDGLESLLPLSLACLCESSHQHPETNDLTFDCAIQH